MTNRSIAKLFEETAELLELQGANPFRIRAYRNAAKSVLDLSEALSDLAQRSDVDLTKISGIGKDIAFKIHQLLEDGTFPLLEELREEFPADLLKILRLPGVGPKKARVLYDELSIQSVDDLKAAAQAGKVAELKGFGKKTEQSILAGLEELAEEETRFLISTARESADAIVESLQQLEEVKHAMVAGSCRRRKETCGDLDVLVTTSDPEAAMECLATHERVEKVLQRGETKQRVKLDSGIELDLRVVPPESYGAALQYFTGSKEHNIVIRRRAQDRGYKLNEYGLYDGDRLVAGKTEEEVYAAVDLPWIPPELRENRGEIELAEQGKLPELLTLADIRGDLHMHTTATDGTASIREMIEGARERGLEYIAITDHSQRVSMANGLDANRLRAHWKEIRKIREEYSDIEVLCGIECDILEDATMDLPDDVLAEGDWVIAVLHYGLRQPREQIMKRLLNAVKNPYVSLIGHPCGRLVGRRSAADVNFPELFKAAADHGVMMEINANPHRLDLDDIQAAAAKDHGIPIVINTDAHSPENLDLMEFGVDQARRAGLSSADVANTRAFREFRKLIRNHD
ncbi:MAG: DNA polymerase/3'-5' exonuclease PolX [Planctomycetaceae bacterium]|nr:DNA polymerase/3'-5' exonuclease PolX [Planctomycetaceae bacterium]